jgi:hypothetical protein
VTFFFIGPGFAPLDFPPLLSRQNNFFCLLLTLGTFTSVFNDNKFLRSHKTIEIKLLVNFWFVDEGFGSEAGSVQIVKDPVWEVQNLTVPAADYNHTHDVL